MDGIGRVGRAGTVAGRPSRAGNGATFSVRPGTADPASAPAVASAAALDGLLLLQEGNGGWSGDRPARRHADLMLDELAALQLGVLAGDSDPAVLRRLAALSRALPGAADPRLAAVLRAVSLRAVVELERFGHAHQPVT